MERQEQKRKGIIDGLNWEGICMERSEVNQRAKEIQGLERQMKTYNNKEGQ
jgi:hypothetical protein